jgi:uncharacterized protein YkwD
MCIVMAGGTALAAGSQQETPVFKDISGHWARAYIEWAAEAGIASGYTDGTFRPNQEVSEREFVALVFRAYPELDVPAQAAGEPWYARYYTAAEKLGWPVADKESAKPYTRGDAATIIAAARGHLLSMEEAVMYLLATGLSKGKTSATFEGYDAGGTLTRAEAVTFLYNVKHEEAWGEAPSSGPQEAATGGFELRGIRLGDPESAVIDALGQPDRRDPSARGYTWLVYNRHYGEYAQIGISGGKVTALFSNADAWRHPDGVKPGASAGTAAAHADVPESGLKAIKTHAYTKDGVRIQLFLDQHEGGRVEGLLVEAQGGLPTVSAGQSDLAAAYERQIFDMTNAFRLKNGLAVLVWDDLLAKAARGHSGDMARRGYFDHDSPDGKSVWDRLQAVGFERYARYAENIAAGYTDAFAAFNGWVNSPGHRQNMLTDGLDMLGVGVVHDGGSDYGWYYTQNFYTPPWW